MVRMYARHQVADYDAWRKVYDAFDRESLGARDHAVYRRVDDPNEITNVFRTRKDDAARLQESLTRWIEVELPGDQ